MVERGGGGVFDAWNIAGFNEMDQWSASEGERLEPVGGGKDFLELEETSAAATKQDAAWEEIVELEFFESDFDAGKPDSEVALDGEQKSVADFGGDL